MAHSANAQRNQTNRAKLRKPRSEFRARSGNARDQCSEVTGQHSDATKPRGAPSIQRSCALRVVPALLDLGAGVARWLLGRPVDRLIGNCGTFWAKYTYCRCRTLLLPPKWAVSGPGLSDNSSYEHGGRLGACEDRSGSRGSDHAIMSYTVNILLRALIL